MTPDLTQGTDPARNAHWWTKERFYVVPQTPKVRTLNLPFGLRLLSWSPRLFLSLTGHIHDRPAPWGKFRGWQVYFGWGKCDATRTLAYQRGEYTQGIPQSGYVLTWTFAEMFALRTRDLDLIPSWMNMGGA